MVALINIDKYTTNCYTTNNRQKLKKINNVDKVKIMSNKNSEQIVKEAIGRRHAHGTYVKDKTVALAEVKEAEGNRDRNHQASLIAKEALVAAGFNNELIPDLITKIDKTYEDDILAVDKAREKWFNAHNGEDASLWRANRHYEANKDVLQQDAVKEFNAINAAKIAAGEKVEPLTFGKTQQEAEQKETVEKEA